MSSPSSPAAATIPAVARLRSIPLPALAVGSLVLVTTALALVFFVAPDDANQGFSQRIFYFHVSLAFTAYACFMLRFSVDPGPQRANLSAVYALFGVVLIPVSFAAIRLAKEFLHPRVFTLHGPNFGGWILVTYCVAQAAMLVLGYTLYRFELGGKRLDARLRDLREVLA